MSTTLTVAFTDFMVGDHKTFEWKKNVTTVSEWRDIHEEYTTQVVPHCSDDMFHEIDIDITIHKDESIEGRVVVFVSKPDDDK